MESHVIYLYRSLDNQNQLDIPAGFFIDASPIVGLFDAYDPSIPSRKTRVKSLNLRPFEIQQNRFELVIRHAKELGLELKTVEFDGEIDFELEEEISESIRLKNYEKLGELIYEVRDEEEVDISSIYFNYNNRPYKVTKDAVAEVTGDVTELALLTSSLPMALITGIKQFP